MRHFSSDLSIVLGGAAGQGIQTVESLLVQVLKREGYYVSACKEYMSRVRGGSNSTEIRVTSTHRRAFRNRIDWLFALDSGVLAHLEGRIDARTLVFGEAEKIESPERRIIPVPFTRFGNELGNPVYASTVAVGVVLGMLRADLSVFQSYLAEHFARKGDSVVKKNLEAAKKGYLYGKHLAYDEGIDTSFPRNPQAKEELLLDGTEAIGLGVLAAGCNFISSYPMSPGTGILNFMAQHGKSFGVVVDQAEDEIAAINQGIGAWYAGARAIVTTSGGGFDLMQEGVSLSGMTETPIVIHIGQRPGPATGLPTRTEQADLNLALYAGHGEFPRAIFAPGTVEEAFFVAQRAFHIADRFQIPVFVLTDQYFLDAVSTVSEKHLKMIPVEKHIIQTPSDYARYAITESGVSPRGVPGYGEGLVAVDSDEHTEDGRITESAAVRKAMHEKRLRKFVSIRSEAIPPTVIGDTKEAETLIVTWGSNRGVIEEALETLGDGSVAALHFSQVYPLPEGTKKFFRGKSIVVVENNATGQFANLLRLEYGIKVSENILKYDGNPFSVEEVIEKLEK